MLGIACVLIWLYLLIGHGGFWRVKMAPHNGSRLADVGTPARLPQVIAIIPARNEEDVIARAVTSLLAQTNVDLRIVIVDDNSTDTTTEVSRQAGANAAERVTIITGKPLLAGWSGKLWAVQQGIEDAQQFRPDYLLLTDADIEHSPDSVSSLVTIAERGRYDLASYMAKLECRSRAERLLIPPFVYFFLQLYPPKWIADPRSTMAGAAGGCILIRPEALQRAGAMESIRAEIIDDCALARAVKRTGGRIWLGLTNTAASIPGILAPILTGFIVKFTGDWNMVFYIAIGVMVFGTIVWDVFASGKKIFD